MVVSINSNLSSLIALNYLKLSSARAQASLTRLASGNRIDRPATDIAALAIGTILEGEVNSLRAAYTNTTQATSLLGVAYGALTAIKGLIERQQTLASQATSSSLTDSQREILDLEMQELKDQIDEIVDSTNFNGKKLIDGTLSNANDLTTSTTTTTSVATAGTLTFQQALADGDTISINGVTFTIKTIPGADPREVAIGGSAADQAADLMTAINNVINTLDSARAADKQALSGLTISNVGADISIASKAGGTVYNSAQSSVINITGSIAAANSITVNGTDATSTTVALSSGATAGTNGDLYAGTFSSGATAYSGTATTIAIGTIGDNILTAIDTNDSTTTGVNFSGISNNASFTGTISGFAATYTQAGYADVSVTVGGVQYIAKNVSTAPAADTVVRFGAVTGSHGYFDLRINDAATSGQIAITNQTDADLFATRLNTALSTVDAYQKRSVSSYTAAGTIYQTGTTTVVGNLAGSSFKLYNSDFNDLQIQDIQITAGTAGVTDASIKITINGEVYESGYNSEGTVTALGTSIAAGGSIGLKSTTNPDNLLVFTNNSTTALDLSSELNEEPAETAFKNAFGITDGNAALTFQVGESASHQMSIKIPGARVADLYKDDDGVTQSDIDLTSVANAEESVEVLENALNNIVAAMTAVGTAESRLEYVSANIDTSIASKDAARSVFLDTDVASEATAYANEQVKIQAAISVLAQSNQLQQKYLKLLEP
jgi:flagellin